MIDVASQLSNLDVFQKEQIDSLLNSYRVFRLTYKNDPAAFVEDCFLWDVGEGPSDYQKELLSKLATERRLSARGPHGLGKSALASWVILWFALTRDEDIDWKVPATASAWRQLTHFLFPEIRKWTAKLNWEKIGRKPFLDKQEMLLLSLKLSTGEAFALASDNPAMIEGAHASTILYIFDEAKTIPNETWDAAEGAMSTGECYFLAISTPGEPLGRFYDIHARKSGYDDWHVFKVTLEMAIKAGRINPDWARAREKQWGKDSSVYINRVLGDFASSDEDSVIPLAWVERSNERWLAKKELEKRNHNIWGEVIGLGVDVGRGGDPSVIGIRCGNAIKEFRRLDVRDVMHVTGVVVGLLELHTSAKASIDVIGIGAGVYDRAREAEGWKIKERVTAFNASERTEIKDSSGELGFVNCLTDNARVQPIGSLRRLYRSRYQGSLYRVKMSSGDNFTATPNHKILTLQGWVSVQSLCVGDKLCNPSIGNPSSMSSVRPEINQMIPKIGDVYSAANRLFGAKRMQPHTVNFHGDVAMSEVDVVTVNSDLLAVNPSSRQFRDDINLIWPLLGKRPLLSQCPSAQSFGISNVYFGISSSVPRCSVFCGSDASLSERKSVKSKVVCFGNSSFPDISIIKKSRDRALSNVVDSAQSLNRFPGKVALDDFILRKWGGFQSHGFLNASLFDAILLQDAPNDISVNGEQSCNRMERLSRTISFNNIDLIDIDSPRMNNFIPTSWLDIVFSQNARNNIRTDSELFSERIDRFSSLIPLDDVIGIDLVEGVHENSYVYTLETTTGAYYTTNAVHKNCRSAAWWNVREMLQLDELDLPPDDELTGELVAPKWKVQSGGKIQVESKDDIKKRIGRSTNYADTVIQVFAPTPKSMVAGAFGRR